MPPSVGWYKGCGFVYRWYYATVTATITCMHIHNFLDKTWHLHHPKNMYVVIIHIRTSMVPPGNRSADLRVWSLSWWSLSCAMILTQILFRNLSMILRYLYEQRIIDQNDYFRYFRLLMSTWRNSICENTFETSHGRFIYENFSVLITTQLDLIQQNLLRKETCQSTAKPADIILETWFEEYPTPP